jgi:hypothetical protein
VLSKCKQTTSSVVNRIVLKDDKNEALPVDAKLQRMVALFLFCNQKLNVF